jgi:hypothetical protein
MNENTLKRRWAREDEEAIREALAALAQHRQGRKFLWWLLQIGGVGQQPYVNNALQTAFNCGTLNVGNQVLEAIAVAVPDGYIQMMKENADERATRDAELSAARNAGRRDATEPDLYDSPGD